MSCACNRRAEQSCECSGLLAACPILLQPPHQLRGSPPGRQDSATHGHHEVLVGALNHCIHSPLAPCGSDLREAHGGCVLSLPACSTKVAGKSSTAGKGPARNLSLTYLCAQRRGLHSIGVVDDVCNAGLLAQLGHCETAQAPGHRSRHGERAFLTAMAEECSRTHQLYITNPVLWLSNLQSPATTSSAARGAKQLVVVTMHAMASAPSRSTSRWMACSHIQWQMDSANSARFASLSLPLRRPPLA